MRSLLFFIPIFIFACSNNNNTQKKTVESNIKKIEKKAEVILEKTTDEPIELNKNDSLNNIIKNWSDTEKKIDFENQTEIRDSVIILNHYKHHFDEYMDYCYSIIDFTFNSQFHNHDKQSGFPEETYMSIKDKSLDSLLLSKITNEITKDWCELLKYKKLIISSSNRLRDIKMDGNCYKIRYMDGFSAKPIFKINTIDSNKVEFLLYNENSISNNIYDRLKIYFVDKNKDIAIFQFAKYNNNEGTYITNYDLYATSSYCSHLPVLARVESEYDICEDIGIEYSVNWGSYITKLDSLRPLLNNSYIE